VFVELDRITEIGLDTLKNLIEFVAYDLSELNGSDISEEGSFVPSLNLRDWYESQNYDLFFIRVDGKIAGFVIIKNIVEEGIYYLNHFFILKKFRKKNVGKEAAFKAFNLYAGNWRVSEFDWNVPAQIFWRKVVNEYTNGQFTDTRRKDNKGPAQEFKNFFNNDEALS